MFDDELDALSRKVAHGTAIEIDDALLPLLGRSDPQIIAPILRLLNETGDEAGMWSIVHSAESFTGPEYVSGFLQAIPELKQTCFWWAEVLLMRILNSDECRAELIEQLRDAPTMTKEGVSAVCQKISVDAQFRDKTAGILAITNA